MSEKLTIKQQEIRRFLIAVFGEPVTHDHENQIAAHIECAELWGDYYHEQQTRAALSEAPSPWVEIKSEADTLPDAVLLAWRDDFIDFPLGFALQNNFTLPHHIECSSSQGFLCDCGAIQEKWKSLKIGRGK